MKLKNVVPGVLQPGSFWRPQWLHLNILIVESQFHRHRHRHLTVPAEFCEARKCMLPRDSMAEAYLVFDSSYILSRLVASMHEDYQMMGCVWH